MLTKKRNITETNYKNWVQLIPEKRILCQDRNSITASIEIVFNLNSKKNFDFVPRFRKQKSSLVS